MYSWSNWVALLANVFGKIPDNATDKTPGSVITFSCHIRPDASSARVLMPPSLCTNDFT